MHVDIVTGLFVVFFLSAFLLYVLGRLEIPFIVSLIVAGIILREVGIIGENEIFREISELGVMLMLFFAGVEFSSKTLWSYRREAVTIGLGQILFSSVPVFVVTFLVTGDYKLSFVISFVIAMSSTAVILSLVEKKGAIGVRYGRISFLVALVQDIVSIVVFVILPFFLGRTLESRVFIGGLVFVLYVIALYYFTKTKFAEVLVVRDRYLIVFLAVVISFGSGVVAKLCGLSPFLGAFLAGVIISESFFGRQIASEVLPIKEIFVGFFFVYTGALIKLDLFVSSFLTILTVTAGVMVFKFLVMFLLLLLNRETLEHSIRSSVLIGNLGEFGLVILSVGLSGGVVSERLFVIFSSSVVFSMALSSILFKSFERFERFFHFLRVRKKAKRSLGEFDVIIVGFGPVGRELALALKRNEISHVILEINSETVRKYGDSFNIQFGDAKRESILRWVGIEDAKLLVVTAPVLSEVLFISEKARALNPSIGVVARVKFLSEVEVLRENGVYDVVCDEVSVSNLVIDLVMRRLGNKS